MAKITRIKASDGPDPEKSSEKAPAAPTKVKKAKVLKDSAKTQKPAKTAKKAEKPQKAEKSAKSDKKPFILIRPLVYLGHYLRASWLEIRQVRWPSRKATWKLFFAILIYTLLFVAIIMLLDALFTWLFDLIIG